MSSTMTSKRGRKPTEVYYRSKQPDNIDLDKTGHIILCLPINLDDVKLYKNIDSDSITNANVNNDEVVDYDNNVNLTCKILYSKFNPTEGYNPDGTYNFEITPYTTSKSYTKDSPLLSSSNTTDVSFCINPRIVDISTLTSLYINKIKTSISCWWCCHPFDTMPVPIPMSYDTSRRVFKVKGVCCSFNCCLAYVQANTRDKNTYLCKYMYSHMYNKSLHAPIEFFKSAPPREALTMFGGNLSILKFRETFTTLTKYTINSYPVCYISTYLEHSKASYINGKYNNKRASPSVKQVETILNNNIKESRKLTIEKRTSKQKNSSPNTLENLMGITIKYNNED